MSQDHKQDSKIEEEKSTDILDTITLLNNNVFDDMNQNFDDAFNKGKITYVKTDCSNFFKDGRLYIHRRSESFLKIAKIVKTGL